ncbi:Nicotinamide-nucleotide amidase [hydrothermal vent metagenome]|uniref:Nicotinamide-nucleotide amidase n=1 Tax=hydrothermal vent metagenome TaxID=652676 RepID=A0A3B0U6F0_9ZZZZ
MFEDKTIRLAATLVNRLRDTKQTIITAESCTGGLIASALTAIPGSSDVVYGGFVTYANEAKIAMIGVEATMIDQHGAVSEQVARAMAEGALAASKADISIAVTGVAGPGGGTQKKPVGLVHFACGLKDQQSFTGLVEKTQHREEKFGEIGRDAIRKNTVDTALQMVLETLEKV